MRRVLLSLLVLGVAFTLASTDAVARDHRQAGDSDRERDHAPESDHALERVAQGGEPHRAAGEWAKRDRGRHRGAHEWRERGRDHRHEPGRGRVHEWQGDDDDDAEAAQNGANGRVVMGLPWSGWTCRDRSGGALECSARPEPPATPPLPSTAPGDTVIGPISPPERSMGPPTAPAAPPPESYVIQTAFNDQEFAPYAQTGDARITGEAYARLPGGELVLAAGSEVVLIPNTTYTRELLGPARSGQYSGVANLDPRYFRYRRTATADANGHFRFAPVPAGSYIVQVGIRVPRVGQPGSADMIFLHELVTVAGGAGATVLVTNHPAAQAQR